MKFILFAAIVLCFCDDREVLIRLYHEMNGDSWVNSKGWQSDVYLKNWHGVDVNSVGQVIKLDLSNNGISGSLPKSLQYLTSLETLVLINNSFSGEIPVEMGRLKNLKYLWLGKNKLEGRFPSFLTGLSNLEVLDLTSNLFSGEIPVEISHLKNLREVLISKNSFTGPLPSALLALPKLLILDFRSNYITALPDLSVSSSELYAIFGRGNSLTQYPEGLQDSTIKVMDLAENPFKCDEIPVSNSFLRTRCAVDTAPSSPSLSPPRSHVGSRKRIVNGRKRFLLGGNKEQKKVMDDEGRVKVDYYGYSKCPDYVSLEAQLVKIPSDVDDLYNLNLYFFARVDSSYPTGFYCMHGQSECYGDFASACAVQLSNNNRTQWLAFTQCENRNYSDVPNEQDQCAQQAGLDLDAFHACIDNDGYSLLLDGTNRADALGLTWSPTIFFNDIQECEWDTTPCNTPRGASDFTKLICSEYTGTDPTPGSCK